MRQSMPISRTRNEQTICQKGNRVACQSTSVYELNALREQQSLYLDLQISYNLYTEETSKLVFTCRPRFDINPVVDSSFMLASMRGNLEVHAKICQQ